MFKAGELFEHTFRTSSGDVGMLAEVSVQGAALILDVAVYPLGNVDLLQVGPGQVLQALRELESLARSEGFQELHIIGTRLSGANPGKLVRVIRKL